MLMRLSRVLSISLLVLTACNRAGTGANLPPEEVLKRAAEAAIALDSVQYVAEVDFDIEGDAQLASTGKVHMDGELNGGGKQMRFRGDITAQMSESSIVGTIEVVVLAEDETYLNIQSLSAEPESALFGAEVIETIAGKWWLLPPNDEPPVTASVTPDPRLLRAQAEIVTVTRDRGVESIGAEDAYHYDITLDHDKLMTYLESLAREQDMEFDEEAMRALLEGSEAHGEIWIDAETFFIRSLRWNIRNLKLESGGTASALVDIDFRNFNDAPQIQPPAGAQLFRPELMLNLPADAMFDVEIPAGTTEIDQETLDAILRDAATP